MAKLTPTAFINKYYPIAIQVTRGTGLFPEVMVMQAAWETGWGGSSHVGSPVNNMFGIKGDSSWPGKVVSSTTRETINGVSDLYKGTGKIYANRAAALADGAHRYTIFRVYPTEMDGLRDWVTFLQENPRYANAGVFRAKTPAEQFTALKAAGYATGTNYATELTKLYNSHMAKFQSVLANLGIDAKPGNVLVTVLGFAFFFGLSIV